MFGDYYSRTITERFRLTDSSPRPHPALGRPSRLWPVRFYPSGRTAPSPPSVVAADEARGRDGGAAAPATAGRVRPEPKGEETTNANQFLRSLSLLITEGGLRKWCTVSPQCFPPRHRASPTPPSGGTREGVGRPRKENPTSRLPARGTTSRETSSGDLLT